MDRQASSKGRHQGMTLVELMVSLVVASILAVGVVAVLGYGAQQDRDDGVANSQNESARAALHFVGVDMSSAGFMFGSAQAQCAVALSYDNASASAYSLVNPVSAAAQVNGAQLPFGGVSDYPPASDTNSSGIAQSMVMSAAPSGAQYIANTSSPIYIVQYGSAGGKNASNPVTSTQLPVSTLALNSTSGLNVGDMALLQVPMSGGNICFRVPIAGIGVNASNGTSYIDSSGSSYMPPNGYQSYASQIPSSYGTLTNSNLLNARLIDLGANPQTITFVRYAIDDSHGFPVLMRNTYSALNDTLLSSQGVAPGVVSFQVLFGTMPAGSAPGTALTWKNWASVSNTDDVLVADVAMVVRSIHPDPSYKAPAIVSIVQPASGLAAPDAFLPYAVQPSESNEHFSVYTIQVPLRNLQNMA